MKISKRKIELIMAQKFTSVSELAKLSGVSRQNISTVVLRGTCRPLTAAKLARALGVDPADIIEEED